MVEGHERRRDVGGRWHFHWKKTDDVMVCTLREKVRKKSGVLLA